MCSLKAFFLGLDNEFRSIVWTREIARTCRSTLALPRASLRVATSAVSTSLVAEDDPPMPPAAAEVVRRWALGRLLQCYGRCIASGLELGVLQVPSRVVDGRHAVLRVLRHQVHNFRNDVRAFSLCV